MKKKKTKTNLATKPLRELDQKLTFLEHVYELKRRLTIVAVSVVAFGTGAYFVQQHIVDFLLRPAHGQNLIYTSPGGGLDFLFKVCIYTGIVCSLPVIIYQILKYLEPLLGNHSVKFALGGSILSALLAVAGMAFGYYAGMPATLHFLFHQFTTSQIHPLIAIQSYMSFVTLYMFGASLLFQVPLMMIFINRIKPLKPSSLFKHERWMVLGAFCLAVIMNPTPNVVDQLMLAGPMILMYQVGIAAIALINRKTDRKPRRSSKVTALQARDAELRAERQAKLADARLIWKDAAYIGEHPGAAADLLTPAKPADITSLQPSPPVLAPAAAAYRARSRKYVDGFSGVRQSRTSYF